MPPLRAAVIAVLKRVQTHYSGATLVVSSAGPIAMLIGHLLGTSPKTTVELNLHVRNTSVAEITHNPKRRALVCFNAPPHFAAPAYRHWVTHA